MSGMGGQSRGLIWAEVDVNHGLVANPGSTLHQISDDACLAAVGWSPDAHVAAISKRMRSLMRKMGVGWPGFDPASYEPETVPQALAILQAALDRSSVPARFTIIGGPTYVFPAHVDLSFAEPLPIITSTAEGRARARALDRPGNWEPDEWADLVSGRLGSWAMALDDNTPVSIGHSPQSNVCCVEAGIWTREDWRGRGLAPAVTKRWWECERQFKQTVFYSTTRDNRASRAVARKLGLVPVGWLWSLR
jgi:hypothetical protein